MDSIYHYREVRITCLLCVNNTWLWWHTENIWCLPSSFWQVGFAGGLLVKCCSKCCVPSVTSKPLVVPMYVTACPIICFKLNWKASSHCKHEGLKRWTADWKVQGSCPTSSRDLSIICLCTLPYLKNWVEDFPLHPWEGTLNCWSWRTP